MRKAFVAVLLVIIFIIVMIGFRNVGKSSALEEDNQVKVLLAYHPSLTEEFEYILRAYESVLEEEGVPVERLRVDEIFNLDPAKIVRSKPVIIFPDRVCQIIPLDIRAWLYPYIENGGSVAIIFDAGTKAAKGHYVIRTPFADLTGVNFSPFDRLREKFLTYGKLHVPDESKRDYLQIPPGKLSPQGNLSSYYFGEMNYPVVRTEVVEKLTDDEVLATVQVAKGEEYPGVVVRGTEKTRLLYVNMPLGELKANTEDLPMRSILRMFLFEEVGIPHLVNVPNAKPGFVYNWHLDDRTEWANLPKMKEDGLIKDILEYSFHVTAGEWVDDLGDGLGFDACGKGSEALKSIMEYGEVGSHGGWAHNWYAYRVTGKYFTWNDIRHYIDINNKCVSEVTGRPVREYSAPNGVFPQPENNRILADMGIIAYYNTADNGSAPNRTFVDRESATPNAISFPIVPFFKYASLVEMFFLNDVAPGEVREWMMDLVDYLVEHRTIRMLYTHPYDIYLKMDETEQETIHALMDELEQRQLKGEIDVKSMTYFAEFLLRFLKTEYAFTKEGEQLKITLRNPESLQGISFALPKGRYSLTDAQGYKTIDDGRNLLVVIGDDVHEKEFMAKIL